LAFLKAINYTNICFYLIYSYFLKIGFGYGIYLK